MPRRSKLTDERIQRVLTAVRAGATYRAAAAAAGIGERTLYDWINRSAVFAESFARAEGEAEARMTIHVTQAAPNDWRAAAWWLERRRSDDYGRRERVDISVRNYAERLAAERGLDVDELLAEAERIVSGNHAR